MSAATTGHTPGPWHYEAGVVTADPMDSGDRRHTICEHVRPDTYDPARTLAERQARADANGRLIARAPDMAARIAELEAALRQIDALEARADGSVGFVDNPHIKALRAGCQIARAALAKGAK